MILTVLILSYGMPLGSLESTQEARVTLGCTLSNSYALLLLVSPNFLHVSVT